MAIHRIDFDKQGKKLAELMRTKGKHPDGGGLYLQVANEEGGQASWVFRHKERWASIGPASAYKPDEATEAAGYDADITDACIAHPTANLTPAKRKVCSAYQRSELLAKRREIMQQWSDFVAG